MNAKIQLNPDDLRRLYSEGTSVLQMSRIFGVSRNVVNRNLTDLGLPIRNVSEANTIRMSRLTPAERRSLARAANDAARARGRTRRSSTSNASNRITASQTTARSRARTLSMVQPDETLFAKACAERGVEAIPQYPVGGYNLDFLLFGTVAVEIQTNASHPARKPQTAHRIKRLVDAGWNVIYLWHPTRDGCHDVITLAEILSRNITGRGEYRVIRGTGEDATIPYSELHESAGYWSSVSDEYVLPRPGNAG